MKDFFEHQERARRSSWWLGWMFALGVIVTVGSLIAIAVLCVTLSHQDSHTVDWSARFTSSEVLWVWMAGGFLTLIILTTGLVRLAQYSRSGSAVAEMLGGRLLDRRTIDPAERRLLNVVDEMSLASGVPVPPVYMMEEDSINAFAAGTNHNDAAIGVTRGCVNALNRDELQGVIGHEFSHIFHGDMRINARTAAAIAGIMAISTMGYVLLRFIGPSLARSSGNRKNGAGLGMLLIGLGLILLIVGFVGTLYATLLQAAMSRQREYLADASAVQYTRNPSGIGNALRKIKAASHAPIQSSHARDMNHFFFANAAESWLATHPPIDERIRRVMGVTVPDAASPASPGGTTTRAAMDSIGTMNLAAVDSSSAPPTTLTAALNDPTIAPAVIAMTLLSDDAAVRGRQLKELGNARADLAAAAQRLHAQTETLSVARRMELVDLACPALVQAGPGQYRRAKDVFEMLVRADGAVSLGEWIIVNALRTRVETRWSARSLSEPRLSARDLASDIRVILWAVAHQSRDRAAVDAAFEHACRVAGVEATPPRAPPALESFAVAAGRIGAGLRFSDRRLVVQACVECASHDGRLSNSEWQLVRGVSDALGCPMPPLPVSPVSEEAA